MRDLDEGAEPRASTFATGEGSSGMDDASLFAGVAGSTSDSDSEEIGSRRSARTGTYGCRCCAGEAYDAGTGRLLFWRLFSRLLLLVGNTAGDEAAEDDVLRLAAGTRRRRGGPASGSIV